MVGSLASGDESLGVKMTGLMFGVWCFASRVPCSMFRGSGSPSRSRVVGLGCASLVRLLGVASLRLLGVASLVGPPWESGGPASGKRPSTVNPKP